MRNAKWHLKQFAVTGNFTHKDGAWKKPEKDFDRYKVLGEPISKTASAASENRNAAAKAEAQVPKQANSQNGAHLPRYEVINAKGENVAVLIDLDGKSYSIVGRPALVSSFFEMVEDGQFADPAKKQAGLVIDEQLRNGMLLLTAEEHLSHRQSLKPGRQYSYYIVSIGREAVSGAAESGIASLGRFRGWKKTEPPSGHL